jgi:hypothetical protein
MAIRRRQQPIARSSPGCNETRCTSMSGSHGKVIAMNKVHGLALVLAVAVSTSACAASLRHPHVSDIRSNPGRYHDRSVRIDGIVTSSWGVPLAPFKMYKVDDGTGEVTVLSQGRRLPTRGARVRVTGTIDEVAVFDGRPIGLHLKEKKLSIRR